MNDLFIKWFTTFNVFLMCISRGAIGSKLGTQTIMLMHSVGRKSGRHYITPIAYFRLEDIYFVVGSNWGRDVNAAWYHNLRAHARTKIEVNGKEIPVMAHEAQEPEYARLWQYAIDHHPPYLKYQKMTTRKIPIMIFEPVV
jgi:deazaflavin-dependent oxidoreductase (nitroreductase family)